MSSDVRNSTSRRRRRMLARGRPAAVAPTPWFCFALALTIATSTPASGRTMEPGSGLAHRGAAGLPFAPAYPELMLPDGLRPRQPGARGSSPGARPHIAFNLEFDDSASCRRFQPTDATVFHRFGRFASVFVVAEGTAGEDFARKAAAAPGFRCVEDAGPVPLPPAPALRAVEATKGVPEAIVRGGLDGLTGRGTLIGVIDSGVDFRNPDFVEQTPEGPRSRIAAYWDPTVAFEPARGVGRPAPISGPDGRPLGTVFTRDELTGALRTQMTGPVVDPLGHGTACAGIAAGNGRNLPGVREVMGVAPAAELVVVRALLDPMGSRISMFLLGPACHWLVSLADSLRRPLVVSCSLGEHAGLHDGTRVIERELEALFPPSAVGRALVVSAGNEGNKSIHARMTLGEQPQDLEWLVQASRGADRAEALLELHVREADWELFDLRPAPLADGTATEVRRYWAPPVCASGKVTFRLRSLGAGGRLQVWAARPGVVMDAYISGGEFAPGIAVRERTVPSPGTCRAAITVSSYDWNDSFDHHGRGVVSAPSPCNDETMEIGALSCYSSTGFVSGGIVKPDVTGPGQLFATAVSMLPSNQPAGLASELLGGFSGLHRSGKYRAFNGTSAATPYVAGLVALAFERDPRLTLAQVRQRLAASLSQTPQTGELPNAGWGHGKLDLAAARKFIAPRTSRP